MGSIDWNINDSIEGAGASLNIDTPIMDPKHKCLTAVPNQKAHGWDDWHNLKLNFRGGQGQLLGRSAQRAAAGGAGVTPCSDRALKARACLGA